MPGSQSWADTDNSSFSFPPSKDTAHQSWIRKALEDAAQSPPSTTAGQGTTGMTKRNIWNQTQHHLMIARARERAQYSHLKSFWLESSYWPQGACIQANGMKGKEQQLLCAGASLRSSFPLKTSQREETGHRKSETISLLAEHQQIWNPQINFKNKQNPMTQRTALQHVLLHVQTVGKQVLSPRTKYVFWERTAHPSIEGFRAGPQVQLWSHGTSLTLGTGKAANNSWMRHTASPCLCGSIHK